MHLIKNQFEKFGALHMCHMYAKYEVIYRRILYENVLVAYIKVVSVFLRKSLNEKALAEGKEVAAKQ